MKRRGFAMITVLWVLVAASAIAVAGSAAGIDASGAHRNRINATRARWRAHACASRLRQAIDVTLAVTPTDARDSVWRALDSLIAPASGADTNCVARLVAAGSQLNVNAATESDLERMFSYLNAAEPKRLAAATMDWTDADDFPREQGAEAAAYAAENRRPPRNGPVADAAELRYVMGLEQLNLDSILTADSARISLANAPLPVLASLPGFGTEVLARITEWRATGRQVTNLIALAASVSQTAEQAIINSYPEITWRSTVDPEAWFIRSSGYAGSPRVSSTIELKLARTQTRAFIIRRRIW